MMLSDLRVVALTGYHIISSLYGITVEGTAARERADWPGPFLPP